ncbi:MAG TPA: exodeoxyribonuclease VII large subunit [Gemmatimonadaceae bacterium]|nr:exodeoxyribonuclease VII large subunit [Gemmatimonadaceae bacterium]
MSTFRRRAASAVPDLFAPDAAAIAADALYERVPGATAATAASVSSVTRTAKDLLEGAFLPLWVRGEVTDFKAHRNGQWYFCLRDEASQMRCVVWSKEAARIATPPVDGMQVTARGQLTVYPNRGEMQFVVTALDAVGQGRRRAVVERTLRALERDGLLAPERKRPLPAFPRCVAVVTSPDGAAVRDIIAVARRRSPSIEIVVVGARVQGEGAPETLCQALAAVDRWGQADVVIIGRGGGGHDDLWAFDDEGVARALAGCAVPTISAVGHEVDLSVCDLVADLRAPTPSAAAEAATPIETEARERLALLGEALRDGVRERLRRAQNDLARAARTARAAALRVGERRTARLTAAAGRLNALSPLATLGRGYAVARVPGGGPPLTSVDQFEPGGRFDLLLRDGTVRARTEP